MKTTVRLTITKNEAGLYAAEASDYTLGRQWDNNATEIEVDKPDGFNESVRLTMDVYKFDRAFAVYDTSALSESDKIFYEGLQGIDCIEVRDEPVKISNHISQFENIRVKFVFTDAESGVVKNTETKNFKFLKSEKPVDFVSYDLSPVSVKCGEANVGGVALRYTYSYLGIKDPDRIKIAYKGKRDLPLTVALVTMATADDENAMGVISAEDFKKLHNSKLTEITACEKDFPAIAVSGITYSESAGAFWIQAVVSDARKTEKSYKLVKIFFDGTDVLTIKSVALDSPAESGGTTGEGKPSVFGTPVAFGLPAGGNPSVSQSGEGTDDNPYRLSFGLVEGKEGEKGIQGRSIRYRGAYVPGTRYFFTEENQDVVSYSADITRNGLKKIESVLLYCITTNQRSETMLYDEYGIVDNMKDCWAPGPVTASPSGLRFMGDWQPNVLYVNDFEYRDVVRVVKGTEEALLCCIKTNSSLSAPDLENLSPDWQFFLESKSIFKYAKTAGYNGSKEQFDNKIVKIIDFAERNGGNIFKGEQQVIGNLSVTGNIYHKGLSYQTNVEQLNVKNSLIVLRDAAESALTANDCAGIMARHYNAKGDNGYLVFDNRGFAYVGDAGDLQRLATVLPSGAEDMLLYYNPLTFRIEATGITKEEFYRMKAKCDLLEINSQGGAPVLEVNGRLKVKGTLDSDGLVSSRVGFNKN